ncbi:MAG: SAM-dependent chlorinase/fluorinase [candidate division FCPU426 bacterium]
MEIPLVTLTTDFGLSDPFAGIMKGVIHTLAPKAVIVDISHQVPPQGLIEAGLILKQSAPYFPPQSLHICVVDPGVGSARDIVLVQTPDATFLAPDNGVLTYVLEGRPILMSRLVTNPLYFLPKVSATFHGRDIFAPVAGHLLMGADPHLLGPAAGKLFLLPSLPQVQWEGDTARGRVISADRFGNLLTNVPEALFSGRRVTSVLVKGRILRGLSPSYSSVEPGEIGALWESTGHLEIFERNGSAAKHLGASNGDEVILTLKG